jgi:hypothetical protein
MTFEFGWDGTINISEITVQMDQSHNNPFGGVKSGIVRMKGRVKSVISRPVDDNHQSVRGWLGTNAKLLDEQDLNIGEACRDCDKHVTQPLYALMILSVMIGFRPFTSAILTARGQWCLCLLLQQRNPGSRRFERVGLAQIDQHFFHEQDLEMVEIV